MRDNHLHTYFSYDCEASFEEYLQAYEGHIVTTEHFDLSNPYLGGPRDDVPDYAKYSVAVAELNLSYGNRVKRGIEIGYYAPRLADILAFLEGKDYDVKLLSIHHNGRFDYLEEAVFELDREQHIRSYIREMQEAIKSVPAHVLAHFDYGFRKLQVSVEELQLAEKDLRLLFRLMMEHGLAFEINTKSMYLYGNEALYRYALKLLSDMGCQRYSIGSDGHNLAHFRLGFDKVEELLSEFQIRKEWLV
ncbi:PHP domain-containing protein [Streptococcus himalayensis]|uniref:Histidinol-phosphatase n=1 Tax=Streptococcus himalayensis TaxID=1888195 RepID=A0A917A735_9STRE|nr:PHP domain-containing protein [Streptococcus himalayensis]GGE32474.1 hypothetical protein GCM10011510_12220 [Streptococcus himalayensis]